MVDAQKYDKWQRISEIDQSQCDWSKFLMPYYLSIYQFSLGLLPSLSCRHWQPFLKIVFSLIKCWWTWYWYTCMSCACVCMSLCMHWLHCLRTPQLHVYHLLFAPRLSITCTQVLFALTQSNSIPEIDQFCTSAVHLSSLTNCASQRSKGSRNSVLTDRILTASRST